MSRPLLQRLFAPGPRSRRRPILWSALVVLLVAVQALLVWMALRYESTRLQEKVEETAQVASNDIRQAMVRDLQSLQALLWNDPPPAQWRADAAALLREQRAMMRIERRDASMRIIEEITSPYVEPGAQSALPRPDLDIEAQAACANAQRAFGPAYSRSYFVPFMNGLGMEVIDVCIPIQARGELLGTMVATYGLVALLRETLSQDITHTHEVSFVESDLTRLARAGSILRGAGVFVSHRLIDLPGQTLQLRLDSVHGQPALIPNLTTALVLGLSLALGGVVLLLARDVRKRAIAERDLADALAFRAAMENSLVTGLRARDLAGRITYVNPAFCEMVGFEASELIGQDMPPYWPPEVREEYLQRQQVRLAVGEPPPREGVETTFIRKDGERFPVMIFEAPLKHADGSHTGWMSAVLDVSAQRRVEELSRQSQEKLQATARLATVGEMASLLSHELNQPLSAIAGYAAGSLNLLRHDGLPPLDDLRHALTRIAEQAERAGRVIKSVHDFVRRREHLHEAVRVDHLIEAVMPLMRLQARKTGTRIELLLPHPLPRVVCDRTMVEQVLLNLTRNAFQAMQDVPQAQRELRIEVRQRVQKWVEIAVRDHGPGISEEVAAKLFTPFFSTRSEGMGLGLSLCRTVVEQHGGALTYETHAGGSVFRFTLPAEVGSRDRPAAAPATEATTTA